MFQLLNPLHNYKGKLHVRKIFIIMIFLLPIVSLVIQRDFFYITLGIIFGFCFFVYCLLHSYGNLIRFMIAAFLFLPIHYIPEINIFNAINPLTFLGIVLLVKIFFDKVMNNTGPWTHEIKKIDKAYLLFIISALISTFSAISVLGALNWIFYSIVIGYIPFKVLTYLETKELIKTIRTVVILGS